MSDLKDALEGARRFVASRPPPGEVLHVGLVGAHYYGFPSVDSDLDLKGMHIAPTRSLLGLDAPPETHDLLEDFEGVEHDLTTHEVGKALALLLRGNGNVQAPPNRAEIDAWLVERRRTALR